VLLQNLRQMKIVEKMHVMKDRKGKVNAITVPERSSKVAVSVGSLNSFQGGWL
jgi:hypothetical protein